MIAYRNDLHLKSGDREEVCSNICRACRIEESISEGDIWPLKKGPAGIKEPLSLPTLETKFKFKSFSKTELDSSTKVLWDIKIILCTHKFMFHACPLSEFNVFH